VHSRIDYRLAADRSDSVRRARWRHAVPDPDQPDRRVATFGVVGV